MLFLHYFAVASSLQHPATSFPSQRAPRDFATKLGCHVLAKLPTMLSSPTLNAPRRDEVLQQKHGTAQTVYPAAESPEFHARCERHPVGSESGQRRPHLHKYCLGTLDAVQKGNWPGPRECGPFPRRPSLPFKTCMCWSFAAPHTRAKLPNKEVFSY